MRICWWLSATVGIPIRRAARGVNGSKSATTRSGFDVGDLLGEGLDDLRGADGEWGVPPRRREEADAVAPDRLRGRRHVEDGFAAPAETVGSGVAAAEGDVVSAQAEGVGDAERAGRVAAALPVERVEDASHSERRERRGALNSGLSYGSRRLNLRAIYPTGSRRPR